MEQTSFLPPPPFAPTWPKPNTIEGRALEYFLRGEAMTCPEFEARSHSWRLSSAVHALQRKGWPIESQPIDAPTLEAPHRVISRYRLPRRYIRQALTARKEAKK